MVMVTMKHLLHAYEREKNRMPFSVRIFVCCFAAPVAAAATVVVVAAALCALFFAHSQPKLSLSPVRMNLTI